MYAIRSYYVVPPAFPHGEEVEQPHLSPVGGESRLENQRPLQVTPGDRALPDGEDAAVAALFPVEQPAEAAGRIDARHAAPVDGTGTGDERRRVAVGDVGVIPDWRVCPALLSHHLFSDRYRNNFV